MPKHRAPTRRMGQRFSAGAAVATLSLTGLLGATSAAYADDAPSPSGVSFPNSQFSVDNFNRIMHEPLDQFAQEEQENNPTRSQGPNPIKPPAGPEVIDDNGIRWDADGCSTSDVLRGGAAEIACKRHDVAYRTLQTNGRWNEDSMSDANRQFDADLTTLENEGKTSPVQGEPLSGGVAVGTNLPSFVNDLPAFDGSSGSPFDSQNHPDGAFQPSDGER
ncbi:phospholipase A2 [Streptomyces sp. NPDC001250]|uniref:phospholipase A2 n=1 Tax=unclassified Streptomyces TaxID=2593676 RepID=UPI003320B555